MMDNNKDFIIVHTITEKTTYNGEEKKVSKNQTWLLKKYIGNDEHIVIPEYITSIGYCAFRGCESVKSVYIPEGVKVISALAFCGCKNLKSVRISSRVCDIGLKPFYGCEKLKCIYVPERWINSNNSIRISDWTNAELHFI